MVTVQQLAPWIFGVSLPLAACLGAVQAQRRGDGAEENPLTGQGSTRAGLRRMGAGVAGAFGLAVLVSLAWHSAVGEEVRPWMSLLLGLLLLAIGVAMVVRCVSDPMVTHSHHPHGMSWRRWPMVLPLSAVLLLTILNLDMQPLAAGMWLLLAFGGGFATIAWREHALNGSDDSAAGQTAWEWRAPFLVAGLLMVGLGLLVAAEGLARTRLIQAGVSKETLGPALFVTGLGLVLGMRHSTDADHVVAISTIVSRQRGIGSAAFLGLIWGLGHTIMIFAVGALIILAGVRIPPRVGLAMEFTVALMLILLGALNLTGVMQRITTRYSPQPVSAEVPTSRTGVAGVLGRLGVYQSLRPLMIGLVHGLAGSAAVALLVLSTIHNPVWATIYLLIFGFGTMLGMMLMTAAMAVPLSLAGARSTRLSRYFSVTSGVISVCFGMFLVYQLGFVGGLFTSHPHWTPQ